MSKSGNITTSVRTSIITNAARQIDVIYTNAAKAGRNPQDNEAHAANLLTDVILVSVPSSKKDAAIQYGYALDELERCIMQPERYGSRLPTVFKAFQAAHATLCP